MELNIESKLSVSDIDHKYPNIPHSFINEQLIKGIKVEMEHTDNPEVARKIALDHLEENPFYYQYLDKMEEELKTLDIDKHFQELQTENYYVKGGNLESYEFNTPTGIESNLSYVQQVLVRTKAFKNWFGDWELAARTFLLDGKQNFNKHYENVSKVIDMETLEPRVGYHGTSAEEEFYSFATNKETGAGRPYGYFAQNREYSMNFVGRSNLLYAAFLNIRNPFIARDVNFTQRKMDWIDASVAILNRMARDKFPYGGLEYNEEITRLSKVHESQIWAYLKKTYENEKYNFWLLMARDFQSEFKNFLISHGYDGIFADEQFKDPYDAKDPRQFTNTFIVFDAAQVKLADGRNLKFDPMSADIRYEKGGNISWEDYKKTQFNEEENRYLPSDYFEEFEIKEINLEDYPILLKKINGLEYRKWKYGGIGVFDGNKRIAFADNGSIEVSKTYQKRGIGLELVTLLKELNPNHKFGNMTPQGFNLMRSYYDKKIALKMEKGAELDMPYEQEGAPEILSKGGKMRATLLAHKYKSGGALHNDEGVKDDAKEGGLFVGQSHSNGGIKAYNVSTQQPIEVEGGEVIITKKAVDDGEKREFEGEMLTNKEILSRINESGGGVSFADGGEIHGCGCSGKKYNYGGETLEDYMIIKKMNDAYDMTFGKSVSYVNSLVNKLK
jgi:GNAT superfamily N-acetyltransferase